MGEEERHTENGALKKQYETRSQKQDPLEAMYSLGKLYAVKRGQYVFLRVEGEIASRIDTVRYEWLTCSRDKQWQELRALGKNRRRDCGDLERQRATRRPVSEGNTAWKGPQMAMIHQHLRGGLESTRQRGRGRERGCWHVIRHVTVTTNLPG